MERVIILMAAYQGEKYLKEQLDSILAQEHQDWKLFVRDDGSSDATPALLKEYSERFPDRIFAEQNHKNLGAARNFLTLLRDCSKAGAISEGRECGTLPGASKEEGNPQPSCYYMFADQDDVWHPDKIRRALARMKQLEEKYGNALPALVFADAAVVDENKKLLAPSFFGMQRLEVKKRTFAHLLMENLCIGCTMMMNQALADQLEQIPEHARYHDWWIALLASAMGHTSYLAEAVMDYRQHGSNVVGSEDFAGYVKKRFKTLKEQKNSLAANYEQAEEFGRFYEDRLPVKHKRQLEQFLRLRYMNPVKRRITAVKGGYLKSGIVRNAGLMMVL